MTYVWLVVLAIVFAFIIEGAARVAVALLGELEEDEQENADRGWP